MRLQEESKLHRCVLEPSESASLAVVTSARVQMQQLRRLPLCVWEMPGSEAQPSEVAQRLRRRAVGCPY